MAGNPIKVRVFSDRPVDMNIIWVVIVLLLVLLSVFLGYRYSQKCPDLVCPEYKSEKCPPCSLDCSICPKIYRNITTEVKVTKYICPNMVDIVEKPDDCVKKQKEYNVQPKKTNEEGTFIEKTSVTPACVSGLNGGEVYYKITTTPDNIYFEYKEIGVDQEFKVMKAFPGLVTKYRYFTICTPYEADCKRSTDFYLEKHRLYLFRIRFDEKSTTGKTEYSNEYIIDTTSDSDFITKKCRD